MNVVGQCYKMKTSFLSCVWWKIQLVCLGYEQWLKWRALAGGRALWIKVQRAEAGGPEGRRRSVLAKGTAIPLPPVTGMGDRCRLPSGVRAEPRKKLVLVYCLGSCSPIFVSNTLFPCHFDRQLQWFFIRVGNWQLLTRLGSNGTRGGPSQSRWAEPHLSATRHFNHWLWKMLCTQRRNHVFKVGGPVPWSRLLYRIKYGWYTQFRALLYAAT